MARMNVTVRTGIELVRAKKLTYQDLLDLEDAISAMAKEYGRTRKQALYPFHLKASEKMTEDIEPDEGWFSDGDE